MKKLFVILGIIGSTLINTSLFAVPYAPSPQIVARVSAPNVYIRDVPQNFPATEFKGIENDGRQLPIAFYVGMDGITGKDDEIRLPVANFASLNTTGGIIAFQALTDFLKYTKVGTQVFVECKDPNGCAVVCNNPHGRCQTFDFKGAYRLTLNGLVVSSIKAPMRPLLIKSLGMGFPLTGTVYNYQNNMVRLRTPHGLISLDPKERSNANFFSGGGVTGGRQAIVICQDPKGCKITCEDPNNTQCKTAQGVQGMFYKFSGKHFLQLL